MCLLELCFNNNMFFVFFRDFVHLQYSTVLNGGRQKKQWAHIGRHMPPFSHLLVGIPWVFEPFTPQEDSMFLLGF